MRPQPTIRPCSSRSWGSRRSSCRTSFALPICCCIGIEVPVQIRHGNTLDKTAVELG